MPGDLAVQGGLPVSAPSLPESKPPQDSALAIYGPNVRGRSCGSCTACCTQVPVELPSGLKAANVRCRHLRSKGCQIYAMRPTPCQYWSCRWLFCENAADLRRPDLSGYIVDCMVDTVIVNGEPADVLQIWVDPARPRAYRAPELLAYLEIMAQRFSLMAMVRWNSRDGVFLVPASMSAGGEAFEMDLTGGLTSQDDLNAKIAAAGGRPTRNYAATYDDAKRADL